MDFGSKMATRVRLRLVRGGTVRLLIERASKWAYTSRAAPRVQSAALPGSAGDLPRRDVDAVEQVRDRNRENETGKRALVMVPRSLRPNVIRDRIGAVIETGHRLGQRKRGAFGVGEIR